MITEWLRNSYRNGYGMATGIATGMATGMPLGLKIAGSWLHRLDHFLASTFFPLATGLGLSIGRRSLAAGASGSNAKRSAP